MTIICGEAILELGMGHYFHMFWGVYDIDSTFRIAPNHILH